MMEKFVILRKETLVTALNLKTTQLSKNIKYTYTYANWPLESLSFNFVSYFRECSTPNKDSDVTGEGVDGKFCKITTAMSEKLRGEWKIHMGEHSAKVNLKMEEDISNITITLSSDKVILNQTVDVTCKVFGGVPRPHAEDITFMLMDASNNTVETVFSDSSKDKTETGDDVQV